MTSIQQLLKAARMAMHGTRLETDEEVQQALLKYRPLVRPGRRLRAARSGARR